jgi:hypothetical protein
MLRLLFIIGTTASVQCPVLLRSRAAEPEARPMASNTYITHHTQHVTVQSHNSSCSARRAA